MNVLIIYTAFCYFYLVRSEDNEDQRVLNETIRKYGPPVDYKLHDLPGPEFEKDRNVFLHTNRLASAGDGSYVLRTRTIEKHFSYNGRYEKSFLKKENETEIPIVKGQFGEHFQRQKGGYYVRTIGYVIDEKGYRQFLLDLTKVETRLHIPLQESPVLISGGQSPPGAPGSNMKTISTTVLGTLIGGNNLG